MKSKPRASTPQPATPSPEPATRTFLGLTVGSIAAFAFQVIALIWAGTHNRHQLNTDAVAYLRIAGYYAHGPADLMVSGYWSPLLSWLMALFIKFGFTPLDAARITMGISGVTFFAGAATLFRSVIAQPLAQTLSLWLTALASIFWSVEYIAPDLLVAGFLCGAVGLLVHASWPQKRNLQILTGIVWALAYFAKAVAFPLAFVITAALAGMWIITRVVDRSVVLRGLGITLATFLLISAPWILVLSVKYGGPTFSTSGRINHALIGPGQVMHDHPQHPVFLSFAPPPAGRVTTWEDPSHLPYPYWSPMASGESFSYQLGIVRENLEVVLGLLANTDWFYLSVIAVFASLTIRQPWRDTLREDRWRWLLVPLACLGGIYLPVYVKLADARYFYAALPLLLAISFNVAYWLTRKVELPLGRWLVLGMLTISFGLLMFFRAVVALEGMPNVAVQESEILAQKITAAKLKGSFAGSAFIYGQRAGLYTAYFLGEPWHGDELAPTLESYKKSQATYVIITRSDALMQAMDHDPAFQSLDPKLFASPAEAAEFALKVYALKPTGQ